VDPAPTTLSTPTCPPCAATMALQMCSPVPDCRLSRRPAVCLALHRDPGARWKGPTPAHAPPWGCPAPVAHRHARPSSAQRHGHLRRHLRGQLHTDIDCWSGGEYLSALVT